MPARIAGLDMPLKGVYYTRMSFQRALLQLMDRPGHRWSCAEIAEKCEIKPSTVWSYRCGAREPSPKVMRKLVSIFGLSEDVIRRTGDLIVLKENAESAPSKPG